MFYLNAFLWFASMLSLGFGVAMTYWIWHTRPAAVTRYRRELTREQLLEQPPVWARDARRSIDGRLRDLEPAHVTDPVVARRIAHLASGSLWSGR